MFGCTKHLKYDIYIKMMTLIFYIKITTILIIYLRRIDLENNFSTVYLGINYTSIEGNYLAFENI